MCGINQSRLNKKSFMIFKNFVMGVIWNKSYGKVNINISPNWSECEKVVRIPYTVLLVTIQRPYVIFYEGCTHRTVHFG